MRIPFSYPGCISIPSKSQPCKQRSTAVITAYWLLLYYTSTKCPFGNSRIRIKYPTVLSIFMLAIKILNAFAIRIVWIGLVCNWALFTHSHTNTLTHLHCVRIFVCLLGCFAAFCCLSFCFKKAATDKQSTYHFKLTHYWVYSIRRHIFNSNTPDCTHTCWCERYSVRFYVCFAR